MANTGRFEIDRLPASLGDALIKHEISPDSIRLAVRADRDKEHSPCDFFLLATDDELISIKAFAGLRDANKKDYSKGNLSDVLKIDSIQRYPLSEFSKFHIEELISSGRLIAETESGESCIAVFTNSCKTSMQLFVKYIGAVCDNNFPGPDQTDDPKNTHCPLCGRRYPDISGHICPHCSSPGKQFIRMAKFFSKYKKDLLLMLLSLALLTTAGIAAPYFSAGFFYDQVLNPNGSFYGKIFWVLMLVVTTKLISQLATMVNNYTTSIIAARVVCDLKKDIFSSIERLSVSFFTNRQTGGLMTQVNSDATTIYHFFCDGLPYFIINIVQVIAVLILMFLMHPVLAVWSFITLPFYFLFVRYIFHHQRMLHIRQFSASRSLNSMLSDVLTGARVVKAFSKEKEESRRFANYSTRLAGTERDSSEFANHTGPISGMILYLGTIAVWAVGGYLCMQKSMSYGTLLTFLAYIGMVYNPMFFFATMSSSTANCSAALQRLFEIKDAEPDIQEAPDAIAPLNIKGKVEFKNVDFSYDRSRKILNGIDFIVLPGKTLGIVGRTGAGKTTLVNLILRLYDADSGDITIDDIPIKKLKSDVLHRSIAIVSQETYLFIGTILDNIRYAKPEASYDEVISAAKCAGAHDFIMQLPDAYLTKVGFGYKDLSGGERQRISIARAILADPQILILDEATAAMDTRTERMIQDALTELTRGRTTITIAHRLSTLRDADSLIVIDNGEVAERGTHDELLQKQGIYHKLFTLQNEALKSAGVAE